MAENEKETTIDDVLDNDELQSIADDLVSGDITGMVLIYNRGGKFCYRSTIRTFAGMIGAVDLAKRLMLAAWWETADNPEVEDG